MTTSTRIEKEKEYTTSIQIYNKYANIQQVYNYTRSMQIYNKCANIQEVCKYYKKYANITNTSTVTKRLKIV